MNIGRRKLTRICPTCRLLCVSFFCWLSMSLVSYVFAQTDNNNANSDKSISQGNNAPNSEEPLVLKPDNAEITDSAQENIAREAMAMIMDITKSNILYEKNKSSSNLALEEQKIKDREKHKKEMKEYNERYNKADKNLPQLQVIMCFIILLVKHEFSFLCFCANR